MSKEQEKFHLSAVMSFDDDEEPEEMGTGILVDDKVNFPTSSAVSINTLSVVLRSS